MADYHELMRAHLVEGGKLTHRNGVELLAEVEALKHDIERSMATSAELATENGHLREALQGTLGLIRKAQERLCLQLTPDGPDDDHECMNELLTMFDGPEQRAIEAAARSALSTQTEA